MKQRQRAASINDNTPLRGDRGEAANAASHVYVGKPEPTASCARTRARWQPVSIVTEFPARIPVMPEEVALIKGSLADLVGRILANDNDCD